MRHSRMLLRRQFVQGLVMGGAVGGLGLHRAAWGTTPATRASVLTGTQFDLSISESLVNFTGNSRPALTVNGMLPAPTLRFREGDSVTLRVANRSREAETSLHWHGLILPANMDGVPGLSFHGIPRGESYTYRFNLKQSGTYWYHSHSGFQEQKGLYGAIVVDAREREPFAYDREHVVLLSDWTDASAESIFAKLQKQADYYNFNKRTAVDFVRDVRQRGWSPTVSDRLMWGQMRMNPTDLADVSGYTYTYLLNGVTPAGNWTGLFRAGEKVRLRFINGSAMTYFDVRIPGLKMTVVAADGLHVHPVTVDEFRIAVAETFDVIVEPTGQEAFTIFAQSMDRTGYARGTLALREGLSAPVPALDARVLLTMDDMGGHAGGGHGGGHAGHGASATQAPVDHSKMDHSQHQAAAAPVDHSKMDHSQHQPAPAPVDHSQMDHSQHQDSATASAASAISAETTHPASEQRSPLVDMQSGNPTPRLNDPGIGLRDNGRRVLTYSDLHSLFPDPDGRDPTRTIELHLTGHMELFSWSFNGQRFSDAEPLRLTYGERVRIVLVNDTMMTHPIHLHGMWSDVEDENGNFMVRKHTVDMPPGSKRSYRVRADALGRWAYHCHLLYHMESGMMREVRVDEEGAGRS